MGSGIIVAYILTAITGILMLRQFLVDIKGDKPHVHRAWFMLVLTIIAVAINIIGPLSTPLGTLWTNRAFIIHVVFGSLYILCFVFTMLTGNSLDKFRKQSVKEYWNKDKIARYEAIQTIDDKKITHKIFSLAMAVYYIISLIGGVAISFTAR